MAADIGIMHDEIIRDEENVIGDPKQVVIDSKPNDLKFPRWKAIILLICIIAATIVIWVFSATTYQQYMPQKVSLLIIAWTLGLRHALDADHIAAIDNVTRRFTQDGHSYVAVGTFFSLGHSTIVVIATILIAAFSTAISTGFSQYHGVSGYIGSAISATFLFLIATINGTSMVLIARDLRKERDRAQQAAVTANNDGAGNHDEEGGMNWDTILENSGFFTRVFGKRLFRLIDAPWKMYFVGLLFGLGFDTATEVALLSIAALQAVTGDPIWLILFLPLLFTAGMVFVDTLDGMLMLGAYGWAVVSAQSKLQYNLIITATSCIFAAVIASLEILSIVQSNLVGDDDGKVNKSGSFWTNVKAANDHESFSFLGIALLVSFLLGWGVSVVLFRCTTKVGSSVSVPKPINVQGSGSVPVPVQGPEQIIIHD